MGTRQRHVWAPFVETIDDAGQRERFETLLTWVEETFPELEAHIKWNTPMFTHEGTFIIAFATAKHHLSVSPEEAGLTRFQDEIRLAGYKATKGLFRIPWTAPVDYELLTRLITFNMEDKAGHPRFWR